MGAGECKVGKAAADECKAAAGEGRVGKAAADENDFSWLWRRRSCILKYVSFVGVWID